MENTVIDSRTFKTEEQLQAACVEWFHNTYHRHRKMLHCNNNNSHNKIAGNQAKAMGVVAGVSDLELIIGMGVTVYIELKLPGGKQSPDQKEFQAMLEERGHFYIIIYSIQEFKDTICRLIK